MQSSLRWLLLLLNESSSQDPQLLPLYEFVNTSYLPDSEEFLSQLNKTEKAACSWVVLASSIQINLFKVRTYNILFGTIDQISIFRGLVMKKS